MFRTIPTALQAIFALIMSAAFHSYRGRDWLRSFAGVLALNAPLARRSRARKREEATFSIAWSLGQIICDPVETRRIEEEERAGRAALKISRPEDKLPIELIVEDVNNINILAFKLLIVFGVLDQVRDAFPLLQQSDDPLFTEEAWPSWWQWASESFFKQAADAMPSLEQD